MLMLSRLRHIGKMVVGALLVLTCASCTPWREAKMVMVEADSLLERGVVINDTAALGSVIRALDNPVGRIFAREELAEAYYLMGRNMDDYYHHFANAADYYIKADRMETKNWILCGRINSCMGFICKQDSCLAEALEFYERANEAFEKSGEKRRIANGLLSIAERYIYLNEFTKVDSILSKATIYCVDSADYASLMDLYGFSLFCQQQYDSALTCLLSVKDYPRNIEARSFNYKLITKCYYDMGELQLALPYAEYIIQYSTNPNYRSSAYCILFHSVDARSDIEVLSKYSNERENNDRLLQHTAEAYAQATMKLKAYLENPHPYLYINWSIFGGFILIVLLVIVAYLYYIRHQNALHRNAEILQAQEQQCVTNRELFERQIFDHSIYFISPDIWKDSHKLREQANIYCGNIFYRMEETYHFSEQEIKICLMVLLEFSREQMANYLFVQPNTISKAKSKIAKQLGTSSAQLHEFLITFLA